jgi:hypothetical protein
LGCETAGRVGAGRVGTEPLLLELLELELLELELLELELLELELLELELLELELLELLELEPLELLELELLELLELELLELLLAPHGEGTQSVATSPTHWASHLVLQQYESCAQTAAVQASQDELRAFVCTTHSPHAPLPPELLLELLEELLLELLLPLHVPAAQSWETSSTHWESHLVLQQYESCAQTAAVQASQEELSGLLCAVHSPQVLTADA